MKMRNRAREAILHQLADGSLQPGDWIREEALASTLGISRTPVREAIRSLSADGVLETVRNRGTRVAAATTTVGSDVLEVRLFLEATAASRLAADRDEGGSLDLRFAADAFRDAAAGDGPDLSALVAADATFHSTLVNTCDSAPLQRAHATVGVVATARAMLTGATADDLERSAREHEVIIEAVAAGDPALADAAVRLHLLADHEAARRRTAATPAALRMEVER